MSSLPSAAPRVSVIIPAYNAAPFIAGTLESVFAQTFTDYDVVIVNDGSPDTGEFERALAPYLDRVIYLKQPNRGPSGARNYAIRRARGELLAFLDSDDEWLPGFLAAEVALFDADPSLDLLYSDGIIFGKPPLAGRTLMMGSPSRGAVTFESLVREECTVLTTSTIARRQAVLDAGCFDERFQRSEDFHLWLKMALNGAHMGYNREVLVRHRRRDGSLAHNAMAMIRAFIVVLQDIYDRFTLTGEQRATIRRQIAARQAEIALMEGKELFIAEQYPLALAAFDRACALEPRGARQVRLRAIRAGVGLAPRLLHRLYTARD